KRSAPAVAHRGRAAREGRVDIIARRAGRIRSAHAVGRSEGAPKERVPRTADGDRAERRAGGEGVHGRQPDGVGGEDKVVAGLGGGVPVAGVGPDVIDGAAPDAGGGGYAGFPGLEAEPGRGPPAPPGEGPEGPPE